MTGRKIKHRSQAPGKRFVQKIAKLPSTRMGVAWFRPQEYPYLLQISEDACGRHDTYLEWLDGALESCAEMEKLGVELVKVQVDISELEQWCSLQQRAVNGEAISAFVAELLQSGKASFCVEASTL